MMVSTNRMSTSRRIVATLSACIVMGCASNKPYHSVTSTGEACAHSPVSAECLGSVYQEFSSHDIAFAEFTERGNAFDDQAVETVLKKIQNHAHTGGVVVVAFIHGWKHSAAESDKNVLDFKDAMHKMIGILNERYSKTDLGSRRLVGVYIGWRGASIELPLLQELTFWDRKAVAEEIGSGGITRMLLDLDRVTANGAHNVFVVLGHSFGGAIVVRALTDVLMERVTNPLQTGQARAFGDGVLVLNPAIEANQLLPVVEAAQQRSFASNQYPLFISISSDADWPTHHAFPAGQIVGLSTWKQSDLKRKYYYDRRAPNVPLSLSEKHLDATTVGNFAPFLTHRLRANNDKEAMSFSLTTCNTNTDDCRPMGWTSLSGEPTIGPLPENYPLYFIKTDKSVMSGHNDIFNPQVRSFVFTVIDDIVGRELRKNDKAIRPDEPPLIASPERFTKRMNTLWEQMSQRE